MTSQVQNILKKNSSSNILPNSKTTPPNRFGTSNNQTQLNTNPQLQATTSHPNPPSTYPNKPSTLSSAKAKNSMCAPKNDSPNKKVPSSITELSENVKSSVIRYIQNTLNNFKL